MSLGAKGRHEQGRPWRAGRIAGDAPPARMGSSMRGDRGQSAEIVIRVAIDVVVAVAS
jgi:hypothetical protein